MWSNLYFKRITLLLRGGRIKRWQERKTGEQLGAHQSWVQGRDEVAWTEVGKAEVGEKGMGFICLQFVLKYSCFKMLCSVKCTVKWFSYM